VDVGEGRLALVVAVDRYDDGELRELAGPIADAEELAAVLGDPDLGGFDVHVLHNPTSWTAANRVDDFLADRLPSDMALLHFSGHGLKDDDGQLYLAASNTLPHRLSSTAIEAAWINRLMHRSPAQQVLLFLDCCYGGAFERGAVARAGGELDIGDQFRQDVLGRGRGRAVITASTAMEYAFEGSRLTEGGRPGPSVFTSALVNGIRTGEADKDQDGHITLSELYDYVYAEVRQRSPKQTPSKWEFGLRGGLVIARNPRRRIRPGRLPQELLDLIEHPTAAARLAAVEELARIAASTNMPLAAAAQQGLERLTEDDSRRVAAAATRARETTMLRLTAYAVDFGRTVPGARTQVRKVPVEGGPLAKVSWVTTSTDALRARFDGDDLIVSWTPGVPGRLDATVTLTGPAGHAELRVTGDAVAGETGLPPTEARYTTPPPAITAPIPSTDPAPSEQATRSPTFDDASQLVRPADVEQTVAEVPTDHSQPCAHDTLAAADGTDDLKEPSAQEEAEREAKEEAEREAKEEAEREAKEEAEQEPNTLDARGGPAAGRRSSTSHGDGDGSAANDGRSILIHRLVASPTPTSKGPGHFLRILAVVAALVVLILGTAWLIGHRTAGGSLAGSASSSSSSTSASGSSTPSRAATPTATLTTTSYSAQLLSALTSKVASASCEENDLYRTIVANEHSTPKKTGPTAMTAVVCLDSPLAMQLFPDVATARKALHVSGMYSPGILYSTTRAGSCAHGVGHHEAYDDGKLSGEFVCLSYPAEINPYEFDWTVDQKRVRVACLPDDLTSSSNISYSKALNTCIGLRKSMWR
jgi:Caspase domain